MKIIKPHILNEGDKVITNAEPILANLSFNIHKLTSRPKPKDKKKIVIISCFSEFGCETVGVMYCIPRILKRYEGYYVIVMGWYGRMYFYRHLVDEFWELKEEFQWLREYARAFHHASINLKRAEKMASSSGKVISSIELGMFAVGNWCFECKHSWGSTENAQKCPKCGSNKTEPSVLGNAEYYKPRAVHIPRPSDDKMEMVRKYLGLNPVGIFARARKCYGRNLQPEFYVKLINLLEGIGYHPIWLGEKQSTLECPVNHIVDFSRMPESRDLELTMAITSQLRFTCQFWTASTRLAGMMGVPYLLFESPDQIWGHGQEGMRRNLCDCGPSKLVAAHYKNVYNDNDKALEVVKKAIFEMEEGNFQEIFALLESNEIVKAMRDSNKDRLVK